MLQLNNSISFKHKSCRSDHETSYTIANPALHSSKSTLQSTSQTFTVKSANCLFDYFFVSPNYTCINWICMNFFFFLHFMIRKFPGYQFWRFQSFLISSNQDVRNWNISATPLNECDIPTYRVSTNTLVTTESKLFLYLQNSKWVEMSSGYLSRSPLDDYSLSGSERSLQWQSTWTDKQMCFKRENRITFFHETHTTWSVACCSFFPFDCARKDKFVDAKINYLKFHHCHSNLWDK